MDSENVRNDIRRILKTFGVKADDAILAYLEQHPEIQELNLRIRLETVTPASGEDLVFQVEGTVRRDA